MPASSRIPLPPPPVCRASRIPTQKRAASHVSAMLATQEPSRVKCVRQGSTRLSQALRSAPTAMPASTRPCRASTLPVTTVWQASTHTQLSRALAAAPAARRLDRALAQSRMAPATTVTKNTADGSLVLQVRSASLSHPSAPRGGGTGSPSIAARHHRAAPPRRLRNCQASTARVSYRAMCTRHLRGICR